MTPRDIGGSRKIAGKQVEHVQSYDGAQRKDHGPIPISDLQLSTDWPAMLALVAGLMLAAAALTGCTARQWIVNKASEAGEI